MKPVVLLPPEIAEFVQSGLSITVASRDERLVPSIAKGVGCRIAPERDRVTVFVFAPGAERLRADIERCGRIAVTFSQPSTHRTVQVKGSDARVAPAAPTDLALVRRHLALFADDLRPLGWEAAFVTATFWHDDGELLAIGFTPECAFQQTPGPAAGRVLDAAGTAQR